MPRWALAGAPADATLVRHRLLLVPLSLWVLLLSVACGATEPGASPADGLEIGLSVPAPTSAAPAPVTGAASGEGVTDASPRATVAETPPPPVVVEGWRMEIPGLAVSAPVIPLGITTAGVMEVPQDARTVGWYEFSAAPGASGNAVLAAHVDYRGAPGVFSGIQTLAAGDVVSFSLGGRTLVYVVQSVALVPATTADTAAIIGVRHGPATLTLITCGGEFNRQRRDYDQRVVVTGTLAVTVDDGS